MNSTQTAPVTGRVDNVEGKIMSIIPEKRARVEEFEARARQEGRG
jgi:hypothetical protein